MTYLTDHFPIFWQRAEGAWVEDVDGNRYLDFTGAFAVASLGHGAPAVRQALQNQADQLWHGMGDVHPTEAKVRLLQRLAELAPGNLSVTLLANSGFEAVEAALKTARLATGHPGVIAFQGAYHGLGYGTLEVTDREYFRAPFRDQLGGFSVHLPYGALEPVETFLRSKQETPRGPVGAMIVEPAQGRGGVLLPPPDFLPGLKDLASRFGLLLIADEIFTGWGRTGRRFGVDHFGVVPDLLCVGKAMANGFPISACMGSPEVMSSWGKSTGEALHTSTFLGNPLGCAMALASLEILEREHLAERAAQRGAAWLAELKALERLPAVQEVRGIGLMVGIELSAADSAQAFRIVQTCLQRGLILLAGGPHHNVLTLTPPLTISEDEIKVGTKILEEALVHGT